MLCPGSYPHTLPPFSSIQSSSVRLFCLLHVLPYIFQVTISVLFRTLCTEIFVSSELTFSITGGSVAPFTDILLWNLFSCSLMVPCLTDALKSPTVLGKNLVNGELGILADLVICPELCQQRRRFLGVIIAQVGTFCRKWVCNWPGSLAFGFCRLV